jgi:prepilin-type N-terminal cleavage/methylation domain-containing protein
MKKTNNKGFTIIELLIATVTFSVILLIITGAIIQFSKVYYKGVVSSRTQEAARSVVDEVSKAAQFSPDFKEDTNAAGGLAWCFGNKRFSFAKDTVLTTLR